MRVLLAISWVVWVFLLIGCELLVVPVYGPYTVTSASCSGGSCRIVLDDGQRVNFAWNAISGDKVCHLPKSLPKWWFCDKAVGYRFEWMGRHK